MLNEDSQRPDADGVQPFTVGVPDAPPLEIQSPAITALACIGGLLVPGLGHLILKRWVRGALLMFAVLVMFGTGIAMNGSLYKLPEAESLMSFNTLGIFANAGAGLAYLLTIQSGGGEGVPTTQTFDYGWAYLIVAGLLNYLAVLDAFDIARGRKP